MNPLRWLGAAAAVAFLVFSVHHSLLDLLHVTTRWPAWLCVAAGFVLAYARGLAPWRLKVSSLLFASTRRAFHTALFLTATTLYAVTSWVVFDAVPHMDDDVSALFQARIFLSGRVTLPVTDTWDFFWCHLTLDPRFQMNHICSMYPPGHPLVLAPGVWIGLPWLVTPLFGAGLTVTTSAVARQIYGRRVGRLAGLFMLLSPLLGILSATHLSHMPTAFFCVLALWAVCRLLRTRNAAFGLLAGAALGMAFLCRPLTSLVMGCVIALGPLWCWRRALARWKGVLAAVAMVLLAAAALAAYQQIITGDFRTPGHEIGLGRRGKFGFGYIDWARTHTLALGYAYTLDRMRAINEALLGWPLPAMLFALLPFFTGRGRKEDAWLLLPTLALLGTFSAFWYLEVCYPGRYISEAMPLLVILAARGWATLQGVLCRWSASPRLHRLPGALIAGFVLFDLAVFMPAYWRAFPSNHGDVEVILPRIVRDYGITHALVFMDAVDLLNKREDRRNDFYASGFMRNNLALDGPVIYARNLRERNHVLHEKFPDRACYLYRYNRARNKAHLYRMEFDGQEQTLTPVTPRTRHLLPSPGP